MSWRAQGMRTWILQRLTAVYMVLYLLVFTFYLFSLSTLSYSVWRDMFTNPVVNIATFFFFFSILYHAWVGVRDILIDYLPWAPLRFLVWSLMTFTLIALGVWAAMILYSVVEL